MYLTSDAVVVHIRCEARNDLRPSVACTYAAMNEGGRWGGSMMMIIVLHFPVSVESYIEGLPHVDQNRPTGYWLHSYC